MADVAGAFCGVQDVADRTGIAVGASSNPTQTELERLIVERAEQIVSYFGEQGFSFTPEAPSGWPDDDPIDVTTNAGYTKREMIRQLNAVGGAIEQCRHHFRTVAPSKSNKTADLEKEYIRLQGRALQRFRQAASRGAISSPYDDGEIDEPTARDDSGAERVPITMQGDDL